MISYRGLKKQGSQTVVDKLFTDRHRDIKKKNRKWIQSDQKVTNVHRVI